jgi:hypothetical protein
MIVFSGIKAHEALSSAEAFCREVGLSFGGAGEAALDGDAVTGPIFLELPASCAPERLAAIEARVAEMLV